MPTGFAAVARGLGFALDDRQLARFAAYRNAIVEASRRFNLTAVKTPAAIERRHFLESLALARLLIDRGLLPEGCRVIDIGSGAGLPGLPLKIARPDLQVTLLEANAKRCAFLRETLAVLGLEGVEVVQGRAETLAHDPALRATFDVAVARAVAPLPALLEYALPFLRCGGHLAATKGSAAKRELAASSAALKTLGGELKATLPLVVPGLPGQTVVLVEKTAATPDRFPRRAGLPGKRPL